MYSDNFNTLERAKKMKKNSNGLLKTTPAVDIYETKDNIVLHFEMPGVRKDDLRVAVEDGILTVSGSRHNNSTSGECILRETSDLVYERQFDLGKNLNHEKIDASYQGGVLKLSIAKKEEVKPRKIQIN